MNCSAHFCAASVSAELTAWFVNGQQKPVQSILHVMEIQFQLFLKWSYMCQERSCSSTASFCWNHNYSVYVYTWQNRHMQESVRQRLFTLKWFRLDVLTDPFLQFSLSTSVFKPGYCRLLYAKLTALSPWPDEDQCSHWTESTVVNRGLYTGRNLALRYPSWYRGNDTIYCDILQYYRHNRFFKEFNCMKTVITHSTQKMCSL